MAESKETKVEREQRRSEIMSLGAELLDSTNSEVEKLAELSLLATYDRVKENMDVLELLVRQLSNMETILDLQSQLNKLLAPLLRNFEERLSKIEDTEPTENIEIKNLAARVEQEETTFAQYRGTLEELRVWSQGKLADWIRKRFGGDSPDDEQQ